ncbi:hypothetical protein PITCH_A650015 [uncultured Desulfobacterium sp.]|uniref:Uncharacterized protein n=1 Tax=uncultured Desulfobacterium sp. TaxID=201089 RepID=A0A445N1L7_9BACT|nr:hypothetical protein PITCH_A650015 [uncultured Desulfobacterium sp.]
MEGGQNKGLRGDALIAALEKQTWDPSGKSPVNFPQLLKMMNYPAAIYGLSKKRCTKQASGN